MGEGFRVLTHIVASISLAVTITRWNSRKVVAVKVHHLIPRGHEVTYEQLLPVVATVDLSEGPELGVRAEDQVCAGGGPLEVTGLAVASLEDTVR